jgi:hypothetical protein
MGPFSSIGQSVGLRDGALIRINFLCCATKCAGFFASSLQLARYQFVKLLEQLLPGAI